MLLTPRRLVLAPTRLVLTTRVMLAAASRLVMLPATRRRVPGLTAVGPRNCLLEAARSAVQ